jgi:hypothetical protein
MVLKNFNVETKVLDPNAASTYFLVYTDVFTTQNEAQQAIKDIEKTSLLDYLIGHAWIYQLTQIINENE